MDPAFLEANNYTTSFVAWLEKQVSQGGYVAEQVPEANLCVLKNNNNQILMKYPGGKFSDEFKDAHYHNHKWEVYLPLAGEGTFMFGEWQESPVRGVIQESIQDLDLSQLEFFVSNIDDELVPIIQYKGECYYEGQVVEGYIYVPLNERIRVPFKVVNSGLSHDLYNSGDPLSAGSLFVLALSAFPDNIEVEGDFYPVET